MQGLQVGVSSFAFGWAISASREHGSAPFTAESLLDFAVAHHVPVIQIGDNLPLHALAPAELSALAQRARAHGVAIETGARGLTSDHLERYIDLSRELDARLLRFVIDAESYEPSPAEVVALVREAVPALEHANVVLGIENHDRFTSATLHRIIADIGSRRVGICLDTANCLGAGEGIREVLAQLADVCVNVHVKDFAIERLPHQMGFTVTGRCLGDGMLPLDETLRAVATHGRCRTAVVETWPAPERELAATLLKEAAWAVRSVGALRSALARSA